MPAQVFDVAGRLLTGTGDVRRYRCLHIPSGHQDTQEAMFQTYTAFLACLARWNGAAPGFWQYWPAEHGPARLDTTF